MLDLAIEFVVDVVMFILLGVVYSLPVAALLLIAAQIFPLELTFFQSLVISVIPMVFGRLFVRFLKQGP